MVASMWGFLSRLHRIQEGYRPSGEGKSPTDFTIPASR
jgi:hypothetical protein